MRWVEVFSDNLERVAYGMANQTLYIKFHKSEKVYQYLRVPYEVYLSLINAESKGKFFHANIKNKYEFV